MTQPKWMIFVLPKKWGNVSLLLIKAIKKLMWRPYILGWSNLPKVDMGKSVLIFGSQRAPNLLAISFYVHDMKPLWPCRDVTRIPILAVCLNSFYLFLVYNKPDGILVVTLNDIDVAKKMRICISAPNQGFWNVDMTPLFPRLVKLAKSGHRGNQFWSVFLNDPPNI